MTFQVTFRLLFMHNFSSAAFKFCLLIANFQLSCHLEVMSSWSDIYCFFSLKLKIFRSRCIRVFGKINLSAAKLEML